MKPANTNGKPVMPESESLIVNIAMYGASISAAILIAPRLARNLFWLALWCLIMIMPHGLVKVTEFIWRVAGHAKADMRNQVSQSNN